MAQDKYADKKTDSPDPSRAAADDIDRRAAIYAAEKSETASPKSGVPDDLTDLRARMSTLENQVAQLEKQAKTYRR